MHMWEIRWAAYRAAKNDFSACKLLFWDVVRLALFAVGFCLGMHWHDALMADVAGAARLMIGVVAFGTFLASFVLSVMNSAGGRELTLMPDATRVRHVKERLLWLLSDQLIMTVSAVLTAITGLAWLGVVSVSAGSAGWLTGGVLGFAGLTAFNALRLPIQIWELRASLLEEEQLRAHVRINKETQARFE